MTDLIAITSDHALFGLSLTVAAYALAVLLWRWAGADTR